MNLASVEGRFRPQDYESRPGQLLDDLVIRTVERLIDAAYGPGHRILIGAMPKLGDYVEYEFVLVRGEGEREEVK